MATRIETVRDVLLNGIRNNYYYRHIVTFSKDETFMPPIPPGTIVSYDRKAFYNTDKKVFVSSDANVMQ